MKLSNVINEHHENIKYLKNVPLPHNLIADPSCPSTVDGADVIVFGFPHQFMDRICADIKPSVKPNAIGISLIKGIEFDRDTKKPLLISQMIANQMGIRVGVLMGANIANEVAMGQFCETTVACDPNDSALLKQLFHQDNFLVRTVDDVPSAELCGALKNVVALGAGFCDGLGMGGNTKAAVIRIGLQEMISFSREFFPSSRDSTFLESCGVADLITTCMGGRNRKCAEAFITTKKSWDELEAIMLNGQKLQGTITCKDV